MLILSWNYTENILKVKGNKQIYRYRISDYLYRQVCNHIRYGRVGRAWQILRRQERV